MKAIVKFPFLNGEPIEFDNVDDSLAKLLLTAVSQQSPLTGSLQTESELDSRRRPSIS